MILQLYFQRRFAHTIIAVRYYNTVYSDGDNSLRVGDDMKNLFSRSTGVSPSLFTVEAMARETMADVQKGVDASLYLIEQNEMASGAKRLMENYLPGEYLPAIRTLSREIKRKVQAYEQKRTKLLAAVEVKDYALVEELLPEIMAVAHDFEDTKYRALVRTARSQVEWHLAKAQDAAFNGERAVVHSELQAAGEIWPSYPGIQDTAKQLMSVSSEQGKALGELNNLLSQGNDRAIFEQKEKFIAAVALAPQEKQSATRLAIERIGKIDATLALADEIARSGNVALAWERLEELNAESKDVKISERLADYSSRAADYVAIVRKARSQAEQENLGSAMALYLQAQHLAPMAEIPSAELTRIAQSLQDL